MRNLVRSTLVALILTAVCAVQGFAQSQANTPFPVAQYYAAAFAQWSIPLDSPNTYVFQGRSRCNATANNVPFFNFATNAPVYIQDQNPAMSEVRTPSAVQLTAGTCGVTIAPGNQHYTAWLRSGTGGLQETINNVSGTANSPAVIILDRNWYSYAYQVPGVTPQSIIAALAGNVGTVIQDITVAPNNFYTWNGSAYSPSGAGAGLLSNLKVTSYTNIAAPTALTTATPGTGYITTAVTGGTLPTGAAYRLGATCVDASGGETTLSVDTAGTAVVTTGAGALNSITVTSPAGCTAALGAVGWRLYMTAASGGTLTEILYSPTCTATQLQYVFPSATVCAIGSNATVTAVITGTATVPPISSAFPRGAGSADSFPPFTAQSTVASGTTQTLGVINLPAGFLNSLGRSFMVCGNGYVTTNGTGGTLGFSLKLASVPGVTAITPFTTTTAAVPASATQTPFDYCVTLTTAATGATGTVEAHGWLTYAPTTATPQLGTTQIDNIFAVSSTVDLTKADQLSFTVLPTTVGLSAAQLRQTNIATYN